MACTKPQADSVLFSRVVMQLRCNTGCRHIYPEQGYEITGNNRLLHMPLVYVALQLMGKIICKAEDGL